MDKILQFARRERALVIALLVILVLPLMGFALLAPVKTGRTVLCKYKHTLVKDVDTKWVLRWTADDYGIDTVKIVCGKHKRLEKMWADAESKKKNGDYAGALSVLKAIQAADPAYPGLTDELAAVADSAGQDAPPGTDNGGENTAPPADTTPGGDTDPVYSGELDGFFPASLNGYTLIGATKGSMSANRVYGSDLSVHPKVASLTIQLDQAGSDDLAEQEINKDIKSYYAANGKTESIDGTQVYFGTDNHQLAVAVYHIGGVIFLIEMRSAGPPPTELFEELMAIARIVP